MPRRRYLAVLALAAGLALPGCGDKAEPVAATQPVVISTPTATATPPHGRYYESNLASQKCLAKSVERERNRCLDRVEKRFNVDKPKPKRQSLKACLEDTGLTATDYSSPSMLMMKDEYDESAALINRQDSAAEAKRIVSSRAKADPEARDEHAIGRYVVEYPDGSSADRDAIRHCIKQH